MKRDLDLCAKIENIIDNSENPSDDERIAITEMYQKYKEATYENHNDRHKFYQDEIVSMINDFGFRHEELAKKLANEHPTLQQNFMRLVSDFIQEMAKKKFYDDRNKNSVEFAKEVMPIIEKFYFPCI